jgi:hypothetical protein
MSFDGLPHVCADECPLSGYLVDVTIAWSHLYGQMRDVEQQTFKAAWSSPQERERILTDLKGELT